MPAVFIVRLAMVLAAACAVLGVAGAIYFSLVIWAASRFRVETKPVAGRQFAPPVSILKSLRGLDPHMYAAFRSHCLLDYPEYEVLFGVHDLSDPALALVERLREEFPGKSVRVIHCPAALGLNGKVSNLVQMLGEARYEHVIINDSDIVVPRDYLVRVFAPMAQPGTGMATSLYRGIPGSTLWSRLEALGLSADFGGGVLIARAMEGGIRFALGATIATTKTVLRDIGGLEQLVDYLGDDYEIGARAAAAGHRIALAGTVVETTLPDYSFAEFWKHQMRWARNVKDRRPAQYIGLVATFGLPFAIFAVLLQPFAWWTWLVLAIAAVTRVSAAVIVGRGVLADHHVMKQLWLLPLRDFIALLIWIGSFGGDTVEWRGLRFKLREGKLQKL